jgi:hypothetical protein
MNYSVEQECNSFLKQKVYDWQSTFQSDAIPIPTYPPVLERPATGNLGKEVSVNFMGRLTRELLCQTDPKHTTYVESMQGWYDAKGAEVVGIRTFSLLHRGQCRRQPDHALPRIAFSFLACAFAVRFPSVSLRYVVRCAVAFLSSL